MPVSPGAGFAVDRCIGGQVIQGADKFMMNSRIGHHFQHFPAAFRADQPAGGHGYCFSDSSAALPPGRYTVRAGLHGNDGEHPWGDDVLVVDASEPVAGVNGGARDTKEGPSLEGPSGIAASTSGAGLSDTTP